MTSLECKHVILSGSGGEEGGHKGAITCSTGMTHEGGEWGEGRDEERKRQEGSGNSGAEQGNVIQ